LTDRQKPIGYRYLYFVFGVSISIPRGSSKRLGKLFLTCQQIKTAQFKSYAKGFGVWYEKMNEKTCLCPIRSGFSIQSVHHGNATAQIEPEIYFLPFNALC
jgi:hypothetical protein